MPGRKINFAVNLPLKIFRTTVANADIWKSKISPYIPYKMYVPHASGI